ncbi:unnamed protein product [Owenia fusiformis]|uniref:Uncharacterized protein n=1 Tax=Owenia fusiformis TaxID=6347 RepID=A0A8J1Y8Y8_OWEFU|nr:unnamed protein product [Owenia fusiformis]
MKSFNIDIFCLAFLLCRISTSSGQYQRTVMDKVCRTGESTLYTQDVAGVIRLTNGLGYRERYRCRLNIRSEPGTGIMLRFRSMNIIPGSAFGRPCNRDWLHILNGDNVRLTPSYGLCGSWTPPSSYVSFTNGMSLDFYAGDQGIVGTYRHGFEVYYTIFTISPGHCNTTRYSYRCLGNYQCISPRLRCDGLYNCMDLSDESSNYARCSRWTGGAIAGLVFGILAAIAAIIITVVCCCRSRGRNKNMTSNSTVATTNSSHHMPTYHPGYSVQQTTTTSVNYPTGAVAQDFTPAPPAYATIVEPNDYTNPANATSAPNTRPNATHGYDNIASPLPTKTMLPQ